MESDQLVILTVGCTWVLSLFWVYISSDSKLGVWIAGYWCIIRTVEWHIGIWIFIFIFLIFNAFSVLFYSWYWNSLVYSLIFLGKFRPLSLVHIIKFVYCSTRYPSVDGWDIVGWEQREFNPRSLICNLYDVPYHLRHILPYILCRLG